MSMLRFTTDDIMYAVNLVVVAILSLLVLLFVVRPLVRRIVTPDEAALSKQQAPAVLMKAEGGVDATPAPPVQPNLDNAAARLIEFAQMQGDVHQQSIQKVGELATRNPYETVSIIRQWMHEKQA